MKATIRENNKTIELEGTPSEIREVLGYGFQWTPNPILNPPWVVPTPWWNEPPITGPTWKFEHIPFVGEFPNNRTITYADKTGTYADSVGVFLKSLENDALLAQEDKL